MYSECTSIVDRETELATEMYVEGHPITEYVHFEHFSALHPAVHGKMRNMICSILQREEKMLGVPRIHLFLLAFNMDARSVRLLMDNPSQVSSYSLRGIVKLLRGGFSQMSYFFGATVECI